MYAKEQVAKVNTAPKVSQSRPDAGALGRHVQRGADDVRLQPAAAAIVIHAALHGTMRKRVQPAEPPVSPTPPQAAASAAPPQEVKAPKSKLYCGECGLPQRDPLERNVWSCPNGHVDAPVVSEREAEFIRSRLLAQTDEEYQRTRGMAGPTEQKLRELEEATDALVASGTHTDGEVVQVLGKATDAIAAVSGELKQAMVEAEHLAEAAGEDEERRRATDWARTKPEMIPLDPAFMAIVTTLVVDDPLALYDKLKKRLVIGEMRCDYGTVQKHLDEAEDNARDAHRLWQSAILERKRWELKNEVVFGAMRKEATRALQHEKEEGKRAKMITDADVESRISILFPDEYTAQEIKRLQAKSMVDSMQNMAEVWMSRCKSLATNLSKQR